MSTTVMITGAAGNLGRATAKVFKDKGAKLVLLDRNEAVLHEAFGAESAHLLVVADLLDRVDCARAVGAALESCGQIDVLCHIAGGFKMGEPVHETSDATFDFLFDLNTRSFVNITQAVVPDMLSRNSGKIVTVGSAAAGKGVAGMGAYCASKSGLIRLTESMSAELREKGINVNCVLPTIIDTPENRTAMPDADPQRWVTPASLADVISFLASEAAGAVHGASVPVSGLS